MESGQHQTRNLETEFPEIAKWQQKIGTKGQANLWNIQKRRFGGSAQKPWAWVAGPHFI